MIDGAHVILYSTDSKADRKFFRDVLKFSNVDVGGGWLIFALPPAEVAIHPAKENRGAHELYLMCDDIKATIKKLKRKMIKCSAVIETEWGTIAFITLPGGGKLGIYQPKHPLAFRKKE